ALRRVHRSVVTGPPGGSAGEDDVDQVHIGQVAFDDGAGERGAAPEHGYVRGDPLRVEGGEVVLHDAGRLDQQSRHADLVGLVVAGRGNDVRDRLLDADVDHVVAVVGQDDVHEVLADVVD